VVPAHALVDELGRSVGLASLLQVGVLEAHVKHKNEMFPHIPFSWEPGLHLIVPCRPSESVRLFELYASTLSQRWCDARPPLLRSRVSE
jgi:DNA primase